MVGQSKKRKQENALQGEFEFHQPTRRGRGGGKKEGTLGKPTVNEVELDMYGAEESDEENFDHEGRENDYRLEARHHSRKSASPPSAKQYGTPTAITANGKPHGLAMASQMEEQVRYVQRCLPICVIRLLYIFPHRDLLHPYCSPSVWSLAACCYLRMLWLSAKDMSICLIRHCAGTKRCLSSR